MILKIGFSSSSRMTANWTVRLPSLMEWKLVHSRAIYLLRRSEIDATVRCDCSDPTQWRPCLLNQRRVGSEHADDEFAVFIGVDVLTDGLGVFESAFDAETFDLTLVVGFLEEVFKIHHFAIP